MDVTQITAIIGASASLLCTLVVGALTYFIKKTLVSPKIKTPLTSGRKPAGGRKT